VFGNIFRIFRKDNRHSLPASDAEIGARGEAIAAEYLRAKGYRILDRNWTCAIGELDLVCRDRDMLVFVEVKSSLVLGAVPPEARVNFRKQRKLIALARFYSKRNALQNPGRFDVVAVWWQNKEPQIRHIENAFSIR
jgi:putative endonuclease